MAAWHVHMAIWYTRERTCGVHMQVVIDAEELEDGASQAHC